MQFVGLVRIAQSGGLQFQDATSNRRVTFRGPTTVTADYSLTLPPADSAGTQTLASNGAGTLAWADFVSTLNGLKGPVTIVQSADVDVSTNVALSQLSFSLRPQAITGRTAVTASSLDEVLIADASDGYALKKVTAASIAALGGGGGGGSSNNYFPSGWA